MSGGSGVGVASLTAVGGIGVGVAVGGGTGVSVGAGVAVGTGVSVGVASLTGVSVGGMGMLVDVAVLTGVSVGEDTVAAGGAGVAVGSAAGDEMAHPVRKTRATIISVRGSLIFIILPLIVGSLFSLHFKRTDVTGSIRGHLHNRPWRSPLVGRQSTTDCGDRVNRRTAGQQGMSLENKPGAY